MLLAVGRLASPVAPLLDLIGERVGAEVLERWWAVGMREESALPLVPEQALLAHGGVGDRGRSEQSRPLGRHGGFTCVVAQPLSRWSPPCYPPAFLRQASRSSLQFQHVPVALSLSSLLAYIKHLAVSSRRALKAGWPRSEVTIQESCILKGFCKIPGSLLEGYEGQRHSRGGREGSLI